MLASRSAGPSPPVTASTRLLGNADEAAGAESQHPFLSVLRTVINKPPP